jgi:hypothetical protein
MADLQKIISNQYERSFPNTSLRLKEQGMFQARMAQIRADLGEQVLDRQQAIFKELEAKEARIKSDFDYRAKMSQWSMATAREEVVETYLNSLPDPDANQERDDDEVA